MSNKTINKNTSNAFFANLTIFIIFTSIIFFWVYPSFMEVEAKKQDLNKLYNSYEKLYNSWIDFTEFKKNIEEKIKELWNNKKTKFQKEKLEKLLYMKKYLDNLKKENKTNKNFLIFLNKKVEEIEKIENSNDIVSLEKNIENILPSYVKNDETISTLTDLNFVNYLEKLFLAFNIKNDNEIWIWNIVAVNDDSRVTKTNLSQDQIFYIPIKLNLSWKKINIIKFLYFLENMWKIKIVKIKNNINKKDIIKIDIIKDNEDFFKDQKNILKQKNIYSNILSTISEIRFNEYIDSKLAKSKDIKTEKDYINYIATNQANDKYKISLELHFYIKWLAKYKLKEYITNLIKDYNKTLKQLKIFSTKSQKELFSWKNPLLISKLEKLIIFLENKKKEIISISKTLAKQKNLVSVYNKMKKIELKLNQAKEILEKLKEENTIKTEDIQKKEEKNTEKNK